MNIVLTGFMGSGKTIVGKLLAKKINYMFVDLDDWIVEQEKKSINEIFAEHGEKYFRDVETCMVKRAANMDNLVIAAGGGVVLREENMNELEKKSKIIYLNVDPETVYERLKEDSTRPLLKVDNPMQKIKELLNSRELFYKRNHFALDTTRLTPIEVVSKIQEFLNV
ncbi:shikimate kinase [bacterium]